jgi:hypothetical protein
MVVEIFSMTKYVVIAYRAGRIHLAPRSIVVESVNLPIQCVLIVV